MVTTIDFQEYEVSVRVRVSRGEWELYQESGWGLHQAFANRMAGAVRKAVSDHFSGGQATPGVNT